MWLLLVPAIAGISALVNHLVKKAEKKQIRRYYNAVSYQNRKIKLLALKTIEEQIKYLRKNNHIYLKGKGNNELIIKKLNRDKTKLIKIDKLINYKPVQGQINSSNLKKFDDIIQKFKKSNFYIDIYVSKNNNQIENLKDLKVYYSTSKKRVTPETLKQLQNSKIKALPSAKNTIKVQQLNKVRKVIKQLS